MSVSIFYESINISASLLHAQFVLDLFFFTKQSSKSPTNLNSKEEKQEATIDWSTTISDLPEKNVSGVIYLWENVAGVFPHDRLSERQLCMRQIFRKAIFHGGNCPGGNCLGAIVRGTIIRESITQRAFVRGEIIRGGGGGGNYPVSNYLGGFPRGQLPGQRSYVSAFEVAYYQNVLLINKFNGKCNSHQMA